MAVLDVVRVAAPDILLITEFDWDADLVALTALQGALRQKGIDYPHAYAPRPNSGLPTGLDLDGDGKTGGARDAQGFGRFPGHRGMALLSRLPIDIAAARDFSGLLWRDLPGNRLPTADLPAGAPDILRLSTTGHWDVPVTLPGGGSLRLLAWKASAPAFRPQAVNVARNHDETAFWSLYLDGALPWPAPEGPFVLLGDPNSDPADGAGDPAAMRALLADPRLTDPRPASPGGAAAALPGKAGDPALDTADWTANRNVQDNLRVDYVLPSSDLTVTGQGVIWPLPDDPFAATVQAASPHRLVWVDVEIP